MVSILIFLSLFNSGFNGYDVPTNKDIQFTIGRLSEQQSEGYILSIKNVVIIDSDISQFSKDDLVQIIKLFDSDVYDYAANIILYSFFKRDATTILGLTTSDYDRKINRIVYKKETVQIWRESYKEIELNYWKKFLDSY